MLRYCYLKKLLTIGLLILLFGGDKIFAYDRNRYSVLAQKVDSGIKTTFVVFSSSLEDAKDEVTLNGWKVLEVKKLEENDKNLAIKLTKSDKTTNKSDNLSNSDQTDLKTSKKQTTKSVLIKSNKKKQLSNVKKDPKVSKTTCNQININVGPELVSSNNLKDENLNNIRVFVAEQLNIPQEKLSVKIVKAKDK
ncbi:MAG: hypothetical protein N3C60_00490 [Calditerrivibrio sp.]|nr:hypothetical protein [Calditerrivibrio sp.]